MQDLMTVTKEITLTLSEVLAIIKEYMVSQLGENVDIVYKRVLNFDKNIDEMRLNLTVKSSTKVFQKRPEFPYVLTRSELVECLNEVLLNKEEKVPYKIRNLEKVKFDTYSSPGNEVFTFSVQKIKVDKQESALSKKLGK